MEGKATLKIGKMKHLGFGSALMVLLIMAIPSYGQHQVKKAAGNLFNPGLFENLAFRNIGPFRGGRSVAVSGVPGDPLIYYMGSAGGGLWKTNDAGLCWENISDGFFTTGSVGAIAVASSDPNILFVGMGEHPVRGVMTSHGDGVYKSTDGGKTWVHLGLSRSRHIAAIRIHPQNPDLVFVAVQGAVYGPSSDRGIYKSTDGGRNWSKVLYINETTGACDLSLDINNPRVLYAGMWDHERKPWTIRSGGAGSGIYRSTDGGESWEKLSDGLPLEMGKVAIDVSPANPNRLYANIEAEKGGVFRSDDAGESWTRVNKDRVTIARAWYYIEIFADPTDPETVYVLNAPLLKSIDGGKTFKKIDNPHSDQHDLWINPGNPSNMILANDGGACITFNGGESWSTQNNQPTGQFYRVIADNRFPYHIYGGQQDATTVAIPSQTNGVGIGWRDWYEVAGGESAFIAFDPDNPRLVYGGSFQGNISVYDHFTDSQKDIMAYPNVGLASMPKDQKYRFNWNAPIVISPQNPEKMYHGANVLLESEDGGLNWQVISPDLTRNNKSHQGVGGGPYTNEGAGGENYNTISYIKCSTHEEGVIWVGSDDGLVHLTKDGGKNWKDVTPKELRESLVNSIEVSPHDPGTAYIAVTRYKFNDLAPCIYYTSNYGKSWKKITKGIAASDFVRVVREDPQQEGILYAGTESGLYISYNNGNDWHRFQLNLPSCPINDLLVHNNDLIVATSGRAFWILDDLSPIQQSGGLIDQQVCLFQPRPTTKLLAADALKIPPDKGKNPLPGVIIDYCLPEFMDTALVALEILDQDGRLVRSFSNQKDKDFCEYEGGPAPQSILPSKKGVNRFNWDLRRGGVPSVPDVFVLGDYRGSLVAPGKYQIRLTTPQGSAEQICQVLPDPRLEVATEDFYRQQEVLVRIENTVKEIHHSVNQMRELKRQIESLNHSLIKLDSTKSLIESGEELLNKIAHWEIQLIQPKQETSQDVINYPNKLNAELLNLLKRVDTHDPRVTQGAELRLQDLLGEWAAHKATMRSIIDNDVAGFNKKYKQRDVPALIIPDSAF